jgi:hypothetical protein
MVNGPSFQDYQWKNIFRFVKQALDRDVGKESKSSEIPGYWLSILTVPGACVKVLA